MIWFVCVSIVVVLAILLLIEIIYLFMICREALLNWSENREITKGVHDNKDSLSDIIKEIYRKAARR